MVESSRKIRVLDCRASDHEYLHKDFHAVLCHSIKYLDENYGSETTKQYLRQVGETVYLPLIDRLKKEGLKALERHWRDIFTREGGKFDLSYEGGTLVLTVDECPAIAHLKKFSQLFTERYCETTVVVNETICHRAGYRCSCEYEPGKGKCVQRFWKEKERE